MPSKSPVQGLESSWAGAVLAVLPAGFAADMDTSAVAHTATSSASLRETKGLAILGALGEKVVVHLAVSNRGNVLLFPGLGHGRLVSSRGSPARPLERPGCPIHTRVHGIVRSSRRARRHHSACDLKPCLLACQDP